MIHIPVAAHSVMSRLCAAAFSFVFLTAALPAQQAGTSPVKIYIMVGQSNMVGHGDISPAGTQGTLEYIVANQPATYGFLQDGGSWKVRDDVWFIDETKSTSDLTTGLGANTGKIGPELGFGHVIGEHHGNQVFIIKPSWGGKSLAVDFRPPSSGGTTGYFYNLMTDIIEDAVANLDTYFPDYDGQGYEFAGFCWHQGYNDRVTAGFDTQYETNMANFINDIRDHLNVPDLPFVIATTGMGGGTTTTIVEDAQLEMLNATEYPEFVGNVAVIDTRNTTYLGQSYWQEVANSPASEGHHWNRNAMTYLHIGMAMGDAMAALPGPECPSRLEASGDASGVTLTWQNGSETPTSVQILRNGVEIAAAAPVVPASVVDTTAQPGVLDYELVFTMPTATCDPLTVSFDAGITDLIGYRAATGVALQWKNNLGYTNIEVRRDNVLLNTIPGTSTTYTDTTAPSTGSFTYSVVPTNGSAEETEVLVNLGPPSAGSALVYEPFDYAIGGLNGRSGSSETGLSSSWNANGTTLVVPGSLSYSTLPTFGGSIGDLTLGQNRYGGARAISASALASGGYLNDGATLWFSAVVGLQTGGNGTNARLGLALANDQFNGANYKYWINDDGAQLGEGVGITLVGNGGRVLATQFQDFASGDNIAGNLLGNWTGAGTTYQSGEYGLIVAKITWGAGATDTIEIFHPGQDMLLPATASSTLIADVDQSVFDTITFARSDKALLDEIRFGATYEAVVGTSTAPDTDPPTPNPAAFSVAPAADGDSAITMTAATASDPSGVEYYFTCTSGGGHDSGWQNSPIYTDTGLSPSTAYAYEVKARDKSPGKNETAASSPPASATTDAVGVSSLVQSGWSFLHSQNAAPGNTHNISVHAGSAGYAGHNASGGATSGTFGDGTVEAYNFFTAGAGGNGFNNGNETIVSYAQGGSPITGSTTDTTLNIGSATKLWTSTNPAGFTTTANFAANTNATEVGNFSGTIDISGYASGHIYFIYGHYRGGVADNFLNLTMKDSHAVAPDIQLLGAGSGDTPNNWEHYLLDIAFVNASGYETIEYSFNFAGNGRVGGIVLDGVATGGPGNPYTNWASTNAPTTGGDPSADEDLDGVSNGLEFVLGGTIGANDLDKLPTVSQDGTNMTFSFVRDQASIDASVSVSIEVSNDLTTWDTAPSPYAVPDTATAGPPVAVVDNLDGTETVTLTVAKAPDAKKFARLKVTTTL